MTTSPSPLDELAALAERFAGPHPSVLQAGTAIVDWLRDLPRPTPGTAAESTALLLGLRVEPRNDLDSGVWRVLDQHGEELSAGRVGEPGQHVAWARGRFYVFDSSLINPASDPGWKP